MLILPLHRPFSRGHVPWATLLLVLINVFVYVVLQAGDDTIEAQASAHYVESGLGDIEEPLYRAYLANHGNADLHREVQAMAALPTPFRQAMLAQMIDLDFAFLARLHEGPHELGEAQDRWRSLRSEYEAIRAHSVTWRFLHRGNEFDPVRMVSAAFLHGSLSHLLGNMLFLLVIGSLVESALGPWRQIVLYVIGAFGASLATLAWRWGTPSAGLGASGAVAAMMGAYCVLWGRRKVRFFYWFFVVFDYVRAPAIWLLPAWLGWEVYNLLANDHLRIGFDAHAGGLITGALFAWLMRRLGGYAPGFLDAEDDDDAQARIDALVAEGLDRLGHMDLVGASTALDEAESQQPGRADVAVARYRCARYAGQQAVAAERLADALGEPSSVPLMDRCTLLADASAHAIALPLEATAALMRRLLTAGHVERVEALLQALPSDFDSATQSRSWFQLALAQRDHDRALSKRALEQLLTRFPHAAEASKARFLLGQEP